MSDFSKWEIGGVPAVMVFAALYKTGALQRIGVTQEILPDAMLLTFVCAILLRMAGQKWGERLQLWLSKKSQ